MIREHVTNVLPSSSALSRLTPLDVTGVALSGGFWGERLERNRARTIPHGYAELERVGTLENFRLAAGVGQGPYRALGLMFDRPFPFLDSDVYKWLEAVGWELGRARDPELERAADHAIQLIAKAQRPEGYINTFVQVLSPGREYQDLRWGHEFYCVGHLVQAAVAWHRALADDRLLGIAIRAVGSIERVFGAGRTDGVDGHPQIEMALVELFRVTGDRRHLDFAARMIELRGHGVLGDGRMGAAYWQDHAPVAGAPTVAGHAVRQLYLDCGAVDVAVETGDTALLDGVRRRWQDMVDTRMYLSGGLGSRYSGEAFGDPYELPPDLAYAETCAAIASVMLAWRLLLATGDPACADVIERTMINGVLPAISNDGEQYFYVNPLQRRTARVAADPGTGERRSWYPCACCPPNLMRILSSWPQYLATTDAGGIQVHQFAAAELVAGMAAGPARLSIATDYPWAGSVTATVLETPADPWTLTLRVPEWSTAASLEVAGVRRTIHARDRNVSETRSWRAGDTLVLSMDMPPRITDAHPLVDAIRGCVALERGPVVYCIETRDVPGGADLESIEIPADARVTDVPRPDLGEGIVGLRIPGVAREESSVTVGAVPYFAWGNRSPDGMRVWIPRGPEVTGPTG